jgi:hypothetical protein
MVGIAAVDRAIDRIAALARDRGVPVVFAFYDEPGSEPLRDHVLARASAGGLRVADLAGPVAASGAPRASLTLSPSDPHPTPLHHRLIADALYEQHVRALLEAAQAITPSRSTPATRAATTARPRRAPRQRRP